MLTARHDLPPCSLSVEKRHETRASTSSERLPAGPPADTCERTSLVGTVHGTGSDRPLLEFG